MAKFSLKADHFITPIKLVLPGIIISLIGATAGYYIFNNPTKNRAKATYSTWNMINQFERYFEDNADLIPCRLDSADEIQFRKDYIHLLEMTRQNILDLKDDKDVDKRLGAIINLKIDSYNETKKISESFLDSFLVIKKELDTGQYTAQEKLAVTSYVQGKYLNDLSRIKTRDTAVINSILSDLTNSYKEYVDSFKIDESTQPVAEMQKNVIGKWLTTDKVTIDINNNGKGHWQQPGLDTDITWKFDTSLIEKNTPVVRYSQLEIKLSNGGVIPFEMVKVTNQVFMFYLRDAEGHFIYSSACRK